MSTVNAADHTLIYRNSIVEHVTIGAFSAANDPDPSIVLDITADLNRIILYSTIVTGTAVNHVHTKVIATNADSIVHYAAVFRFAPYNSTLLPIVPPVTVSVEFFTLSLPVTSQPATVTEVPLSIVLLSVWSAAYTKLPFSIMTPTSKPSIIFSQVFSLLVSSHRSTLFPKVVENHKLSFTLILRLFYSIFLRSASSFTAIQFPCTTETDT